jgi:hypothetical protein
MKPEIRIMANYQIGIPFIIIANLCNDNFNKTENPSSPYLHFVHELHWVK